MKIEIYEDGEPKPHEELRDVDVTVLAKDDKVILRARKRMTATENDDMMTALERFATKNARFLWIPHGWKVFVIRQGPEGGSES